MSLISLLCAALLAVVPTPRGGAAKAFMRATGHPHGWPGHRVDHVVPLAIGGCDCEANLQWQTVEESVWKDRWERRVDPKCLILIYGKGKMAR